MFSVFGVPGRVDPSLPGPEMHLAQLKRVRRDGKEQRILFVETLRTQMDPSTRLQWSAMLEEGENLVCKQLREDLEVTCGRRH